MFIYSNSKEFLIGLATPTNDAKMKNAATNYKLDSNLIKNWLRIEHDSIISSQLQCILRNS